MDLLLYLQMVWRQREIFQEPKGEEETPSPTKNMVGNRKPEVFPIIETNGEAKMKNINPISLPPFYYCSGQFVRVCSPSCFKFHLLMSFITCKV